MCDKEWHHYVLNIEFPAVTLFVDGATFEPFLVTEDYPLHASKIETQLTIGACWQGTLANELLILFTYNDATSGLDLKALCRQLQLKFKHSLY